MKNIVLTVLLVGLLSCQKAIDVVLVKPPVFEITCFLKREVTGSDVIVDGKKQIHETIYEYDKNNNLIAINIRSEGVNESNNSKYSSLATIVYKYDTNGFLTETIANLIQTVNGIFQGTVKSEGACQYENGKLVLQTQISGFNTLDVDPQDITKIYRYEGDDLVFYQYSDKQGYNETNTHTIKNGRLLGYKNVSNESEKSAYEFDIQGFVSKREVTYPNSEKANYTYQYDDKGRRVSEKFTSSRSATRTVTLNYDNNPNPQILLPKLKGHPFVPKLDGYASAYNLLSETSVHLDASGRKQMDDFVRVAKYNYNSAGLPIEKLDATGKVLTTYEYVNCR